MYKIFYSSKQPIKFLEKATDKLNEKIILKIKLLQENPMRSDLNIKKLSGGNSSFRLRVGNIRIIYEIDTSRQIVHVNEIDFRGNVY